MTTYNADDVSNEPTGDTQGPTGPTTTSADWVPDTEPAESKVVAAPKKTAARKRTRASSK